MRTLIRNGTIVTDQDVFQGDILLLDSHIHEIAERIDAPNAEIINADGKYVLPGAVDIHTHMDLDVGIARVIDDFYTGTVAAACGGTTTIVDHMAFGPAGCSPWRQVKEYHRLADGNAAVGPDIRLFDCRNCLVHTAGERTVVVQGLDGYIVAESAGQLLVCKLAEEQHIKEYSQKK